MIDIKKLPTLRTKPRAKIPTPRERSHPQDIEGKRRSKHLFTQTQRIGFREEEKIACLRKKKWSEWVLDPSSLEDFIRRE